MPSRSKQYIPTYLTSAEGLNVVDFLNGILPHKNDTTGSLLNNQFYKLHRSYVYDDVESCKSDNPTLKIIEIGIEVISEGHCGYCSDNEETTYINEKEETWFVALPDELDEDLSPLNDITNFYEIDNAQCFCGGCSEQRKITSIVSLF